MAFWDFLCPLCFEPGAIGNGAVSWAQKQFKDPRVSQIAGGTQSEIESVRFRLGPRFKWPTVFAA